MNFKRGKPKNSRAGCLMCKPNKMNGRNKDKLGHTGWSKLKNTILAKLDLKNEKE
jgi:hypothetical protein